MEQIPSLVTDITLTRMSNSVLVGTMKFTTDQFGEFFTVSNPAPAKLGRQLTSFNAAFAKLNEAFAVTQRSLTTDEIAALDKEGDQLIYAVKGMTEATLRMEFDSSRQQQAQVFNEFLKKYKIDATVNYLSEWSTVQQVCEEYSATPALQTAGEALGLGATMTRLGVIADRIRQLITARSLELPELELMKRAREAMYPEYRLLIQLLNAFAVVDDDVARFDGLIAVLNRNLNYVRVHALNKPTIADGSSSGGSSSGSSNGGSGSGSGSGSGETPGGSGSGSGSGGTTPPPGDDDEPIS